MYDKIVGNLSYNSASDGRCKEMELNNMTQAELVVWLETLAELIEAKAESGADAAEIIRSKIAALKAK